MTEMETAETYLRTTLLASTEIGAAVGTRAYRHRAPQGTSYPCIVFARLQGRHQKVVGGGRISTPLIYRVVAINRVPEAEEGQADALAAEIDAQLEDTSSAVDGIVYCECIEPYDADYEIAGVSYIERGGLYRVVVD